MWIKIKNEILSNNQDLFICLCYIPPTNSKVHIGKDFDFFEEIEKGIEKGIERYEPLGITCIVGDFNARTGILTDVISYDMYLNVTGDCVK